MVALTYLICLDFEATCWEERDPESAEIIGNLSCDKNYSDKYIFIKFY